MHLRKVLFDNYLGFLQIIEEAFDQATISALYQDDPKLKDYQMSLEKELRMDPQFALELFEGGCALDFQAQSLKPLWLLMNECKGRVTAKPVDLGSLFVKLEDSDQQEALYSLQILNFLPVKLPPKTIDLL